MAVMFVSSTAFAQFPYGAAASAMANSTTARQDEWAVMNNIAGTAACKTTVALSTFENVFGVPDLYRSGFAFLFPIKIGVPSLSVYSFGNKYYNLSEASFSYAHKIEQVSLGVSIAYRQQHIDEVMTHSNILFNMGGLVKINRDLSFGAHASNITQSKVGSEYIPTVLKAGFSYRSGDKAMVNIDLIKNIEHPVSIVSGIEYKFLPALNLRVGICSYPVKFCSGAGVHLKDFKIDYCYERHQVLGNSHQISVSYYIKNRQKEITEL